ncbi:hypothetical protein MMC10_000921 [Thelotrema lepadinum]|nr:hypothetical protein [Thelotrema lepadinum]
MNYQVQLNIQLLDVGRVVKYSANKVTELIDFARDLRKTNSDIFVEEELADILGRARIDANIQEVFRKDVLQSTRIIPLGDSPIVLSVGAGPTLNRALSEKDPKYLSTVIQLSFLSRFYNISTLAMLLSRGLDKRSGQIIGSSSISGVLEACTSQTSITIWDSYVHAAERKLRQTAIDHGRDMASIPAIFKGSSVRGMSASTILAGLDYFTLVQTLPDDRKIIAKISHGIVAMIVWAHYLLGLTVHVQDLCSHVTIFGNPSAIPDVLIQESAPEPASEEVLLLDATSKVVVRCSENSEDSVLGLDDNEKHALLDWGTERLRRCFNEIILIKDDDTIYSDTASLIIAFALNASSALKSAPLVLPGCEDDEGLFRDLSIEAWRVFESARILFHSLNLKKDAPKAHIASVKGNDIDEVSMPGSFERLYQKIQSVRPQTRLDSMDAKTRKLVAELAFAVLTFAHVYNVEKCASLPISLSNYGIGIFASRKGSLTVPEEQSRFAIERNEFRNSAIAFIYGSLINDEPKQCFISSQFGWSIFLGSGYTGDPSDIRPSMFQIKPGLPTHSATGERKRFVCDGSIFHSSMSNCRVVDTGKFYIPRSLATVVSRKEFCTSLDSHFKIAVQIEINYEGLGGGVHGLEYSYWHRNLWDCFRTNACDCSTKVMERVTLGFDTATVTGDLYSIEDKMSSGDIGQRICIYLAQEHRALCLKTLHMTACCKLVLKTKDCCEACALTKASSLPGKVLLII